MKFSVLITVYKNDVPAFFERAIMSLLDQTRVPDEIVLVVDGPVPDDLNNIISKYELSDLFKIIRLTTNQGLGVALRAGMDECTYELVARMDSDDVSFPNRFELQINEFKNDPKLDILGGQMSEFIGEENNIVSKREVPLNNEEINKYMRKRCAFNHVTVMFKKESVLSAGGYLDWHFNEDYYLWIRMMIHKCYFKNLDIPLVNARIDENMFKRRGGKKYFDSEKKLQKFMLDSSLIDGKTYFGNVMIRYLVQVLMPNKMREFIFLRFARSNSK